MAKVSMSFLGGVLGAGLKMQCRLHFKTVLRNVTL